MILSLNQMKNISIDELINLYRIGYRLEEHLPITILVDPTVDPIVNFGKVTTSTGYSSTDTSITLVSGNGSRLPNPSVSGDFNIVWWNYTDYPDPSDDPNKEIVRCTANSSDILTIIRAQEGTSASNKNTSGKTYKMVLTLTAKTISDLQTDAQNKVNTHTALTSSIHNFDASGNAPPQTHSKSRHDSTTVDGGAALSSVSQILAHGTAQHTGTIGSWAQIDKTTSNIADITTKSHSSLSDGIISGTTNSHGMIDTHISSFTNIHGISAGLDTNKSASPTVGQRYIAVDTNKDYECYVAGTWRDITTTHSSLTASVHNFDASGNAPPQLHGLVAHTGTIGSTSMVTEGTNLYYTDARARAAISGSAPITYTPSTGAIGINQAGSGASGYLSSTDWTTFNNKQASLGYTPVNKTGDSMSGNLTVNAQYASARHLTTLSLDWNSGNVQYFILSSGSQTFTFANPIDGGRYVLILKQPTSGYGTVTWPASVSWPGGTAPTLTNSVNKVDIIALIYDNANGKYYGNASFNY